MSTAEKKPESVISSQSLTSLLSLIEYKIKNEFNDRYWVTAELSSIKIHQSGHIYLQLSDTSDENKNI